MHGLERAVVLLFVLEVFLLLPKEVFAQAILINEFSSNSDTEWVELYNDSEQTVDLTGWRIVDGNSIESDDIDLSGCIGSRVFRLFSKGKGWLNNTEGDTITLKNPSNTQINKVIYGTGGDIDIPSDKKSAGRDPDGGTIWKIFDSPTPKDDFCFVPTSTPTSTPIPTLTPTPTIPVLTSTPVPPTPTLPTSYSSIYINEFLPDPETGNNEKVEIKNNNNFTVSLVNWKIDDIENGGHSSKTFSTDISPSGLFTIDLGSDSFLNNNGDSVRLLDFNDAQKDKRDYSQSTKNLSWSKDRSGNWCQQTSSFNAENSDCQPVATSVPTSTSQPTVTLTPTVRVSSTPTPSPTIKPTDGEILGAEDASESFELALNNATDSSLPNDGDATVAGVAKSNKLPPSWPFIGIGSAFLAAMVGSAVIVVRKKLSLS